MRSVTLVQAGNLRVFGIVLIICVAAVFSGCQVSQIELQLSVSDQFVSAREVIRTVALHIDVPGYDFNSGTLEASPWRMSSFTISARREGWRVVNEDPATCEMTRTFNVGEDHSHDGPFTYAFQPHYECSEDNTVSFQTNWYYRGWLQGDIIAYDLIADGQRVAQDIIQRQHVQLATPPEVYVDFPVRWRITLPSKVASFDSGELVKVQPGDKLYVNKVYEDDHTMENLFLAEEFRSNVPIRFSWIQDRGLGTILLIFIVCAVLALIVFYVRRPRRAGPHINRLADGTTRPPHARFGGR